MYHLTLGSLNSVGLSIKTLFLLAPGSQLVSAQCRNLNYNWYDQHWHLFDNSKEVTVFLLTKAPSVTVAPPPQLEGCPGTCRACVTLTLYEQVFKTAHLQVMEDNCIKLLRNSSTIVEVMVWTNRDGRKHSRMDQTVLVTTMSHSPQVGSTETLNPFPQNDTFWCPWETSLLKTLWEKEKLLVKSNFSFSPSVFFPFG